MSGTARRLAEAANQIVNPQPIAEAFKNGDKVKVPHKGKMVSGRIIRYDDGGTSKAQQHGGGYVVDVGEPASIFVTKEKIQKEEAEQIDEVRRATKDADVAKRVFMPASPSAERRHKEEDSKKPGEIWITKPDSFGQTRVGAKNLDGFVRYFRSGMEPTAKKWAKKREIGKRVPFFKDDPYREEYREEVVTEISKATKDAYVAKRGSQLQRMTTGLDKDRNLLTGRQQANAVKGIKRATGVKAEEVVAEAEWKSLKKTKVDLNALRKQGYKISVQHGEGDTLYKITGKPSKPATAKKEEVEESVQQIDEVVRSLYTDELLDAIEKAYKKGGLRGVIKGDKQVSDTTVDEVLRDMKPLFGNDMEYAVKKIKRLLKPQDYAKYKTKMEGWGEEVEQIDELTKMRRLGQTVGAILSKNPEASTPAQRLNTAQSIRANKQYWTPERIAKQTEIDAKIRKANAGEAVAQIKQILDTYDKATREMILAGMKSIKESAEITNSVKQENEHENIQIIS